MSRKSRFLLVQVLLFVMMAVSGMELSITGSRRGLVVGTPVSAVELYAAKGGKGGGKDKPKKDKGKGPSVPGIPMISAIIIGLGAIAAGKFFSNKK